MAKPTARTGTVPFAHLLSLVTGAKAGKGRADDEREDETDAEEEDDKSPDAEDDKPEEDAEDDKPSEDAEEGDDKKEGRRARRAKTAEKGEDEEAEEKAESDDDDEEMAQARREGFAAAQARGRRIFGAASAGLRPDMAAHLAFNDTSMSSAQAVAMLDMAANGTAPAGGGSRLGRRMARVVVPNPGAGNGGKKPEEMSFADMAKAAAQKAGIL